MAEKSTVRCITPRCVEVIATHGERYHSVYTGDYLGGNATHHCTHCGARSVDGVWESRCRKCQKLVEPGTLTGLFVPHSCPECHQKRREADKARSAICRRCGQPFCDCCC